MEDIAETSALIAAMQNFMAHYGPESNLSDADELMTTADIADYLADLISEDDINKTKIFNILKEKGYTFQFTQGFTWLLKLR